MCFFSTATSQPSTPTYLGVGKGDPHRDDVSWLTGTASDAQADGYR